MMRRVTVQAGFTIIETVLFIALSTGLIAVAMSVVNGRTQDVQFNDGVRSLQSFIERRISNVTSGSIINTDQQCSKSTGNYLETPSDGTCIFIGYVLNFGQPTATEVEVYQMFGERLGVSELSNCTSGGDTPLRCVEPVPLPATPVETFSVPWSLELSQMQNSGTDAVRMLGFMRSPDGSSIIPVALASGSEGRIGDSVTYQASSATNSSHSWYGNEVSVKACYSDGRSDASINIGQDGRSLAVEVEYDDVDC